MKDPVARRIAVAAYITALFSLLHVLAHIFPEVRP